MKLVSRGFFLLLAAVCGICLVFVVSCTRKSSHYSEALTPLQQRFEKFNQFIVSNPDKYGIHIDSTQALCQELVDMPSEELTEKQRHEQIERYSTLGAIYLIHGDLENMLICRNKLGQLAEAIGDKSLLFNNEMYLGVIYSGFDLQQQSAEYLNRAWKDQSTIKERESVVNLTAIIAGQKMAVKQTKEALVWINNMDSVMAAERISQDSLPESIKRNVILFRGQTYAAIPDSADACIRLLEPIHHEYADNGKEPVISYECWCFFLGQAYENKGNMQMANRYYDEALDIVSKHTEIYYYDTARWLMDYYSKKGEKAKAIKLYPSWYAMYQQFRKQNVAMSLADYNARYNLAEKQHQIEKQKQELFNRKLQVSLLATIVVMLALLIIVGIQRWQHKKAKMRRFFTTLMYEFYVQKQINAQSVKTGEPLQLDILEPLADQSNDSDDDNEFTDAIDTYTLLYSRASKIMEDEMLFLNPNFTLHDLAQKVGTNRTYISKAINNVAGVSYNTWIAGFRVDYVIKLMKEGDMNIKNLVNKAGFSSSVTFYRQFKLFTGKTPSQFNSGN